MANGNLYPPVGFHFKVTFLFDDGSGESEVNFQEVSGLNKEMTSEEFVEGGENRFLYRFPKGTKYPNLVLKRGMLTNSSIINWISSAVDDFDINPVNLTVTLLNPEHEPLVTWDFIKCWPVKWSNSDLKAQENAAVIETLELAYQYYIQKTA